jgi:hypothetical protein
MRYRTSRSTKASGRAANVSCTSHVGRVFGFNQAASWSWKPTAVSQRDRGRPLTAGVRWTLGMTQSRPCVTSTSCRAPTRSTACELDKGGIDGPSHQYRHRTALAAGAAAALQSTVERVAKGSYAVRFTDWLGSSPLQLDFGYCPRHQIAGKWQAAKGCIAGAWEAEEFHDVYPPSRLQLISGRCLPTLAWPTKGRFLNGQSRVRHTPPLLLRPLPRRARLRCACLNKPYH